MYNFLVKYVFCCILPDEYDENQEYIEMMDTPVDGQHFIYENRNYFPTHQNPGENFDLTNSQLHEIYYS